MSKVAVIDSDKKPLEPCYPAVARRLLKRGDAAVWRTYPFTIILKRVVPEEKVETQANILCWDPGSKTSGVAIVSDRNEIVYAAELHHRGQQIKKYLQTRAGFRRGRRTRNLRYRPPRWKNRIRKVPVQTQNGWEYQKAEQPEDTDSTKRQNNFNRVSLAKFLDPRYRWERLSATKTNKKQKKRWRRIRKKQQRVSTNRWIAPSLMSRVFNIEAWTRRLCQIYPITQLAIERVKFDMQLLADPDIHGIEYQQGTLHGREIREYLLELTGRKCAYCGQGKQRLEVEHIFPRALGGTSRPDNLTMACRACNQKKGKLWGPALEEKCGVEFAKKVKVSVRKSKVGLKDAAAINTIRWKLFETLKATGLPIISGTGGKTAYNRNLARLPKTHYYDAASVAVVPQRPKSLQVAVIKALGYGQRDLRNFYCMQRPDRQLTAKESDERRKKGGFNYGSVKVSSADGFSKYDHVEITKRNGKWKGTINCFDKTDEGKPQKLRVKYYDPEEEKYDRKSGNTTELRLIQKRDGYSYFTQAAVLTSAGMQ